MRTRHLGLALSALLLAQPAAAFHTVFDFSIDRFEADGNMLGALDGSPDLVDEFDAPSSDWYTAYGTSSVSGGRLHVQNPGEHFPGPDGTTLDFTEVAGQRHVGTGHGDFTATAVFDAQIPPEGHFYHFTLYTFGGGLYFNELFGVDIQTLNGVTRIEQHLVILNLSAGIYSTVQTEGRTITADDLGAQVHFRVTYDDDTATMVSAFSLDGGVTSRARSRPRRSSPRAAPPVSSSSVPTRSPPRARPRRRARRPRPPSRPRPRRRRAALGSCERTDCLEASLNRLRMRLESDRQVAGVGVKRGPSATMADVGDPTSTDGPRYALCVRDGSGTLILRDEISPAALRRQAMLAHVDETRSRTPTSTGRHRGDPSDPERAERVAGNSRAPGRSRAVRRAAAADTLHGTARVDDRGMLVRDVRRFGRADAWAAAHRPDAVASPARSAPVHYG